MDLKNKLTTKQGEALQQINDPLLRTIEDAVETRPDYYLEKYGDYLRGIVQKQPTVDDAVAVFYTRAKDIGGTLNGDTIETPDGNFLLFPETKQTFHPAAATPVRERFEGVLDQLASRSGIPFQIIDEKNQPFKGRYINDGDARIVLINIAPCGS
jgi:hypothetical protein